jgi:hypothetical protein
VIRATVIQDSVNVVGERLTTFVLVLPKFLLAQLNTHRAFSRNAASSRAIPTRTMLRMVWQEPVWPQWGRNGRGMQAHGDLPRSTQMAANLVWSAALLAALLWAWLLMKLRVHKQSVNRLLEPFAHATVVLSGTDFDNFFSLRCHEGAQPEMQDLARSMLRAYSASAPRLLRPGQWHLPFTDKHVPAGLSTDDLVKVSTARCARASYADFYGKCNVASDFRLHGDLIREGHCSPAEHPAMALGSSMRIGNFHGWKQHRKFLPNENRSVCDVAVLLGDKPQ